MEGSPKSPEQLYSEHREDAENLEKSKSEYDKHLAEAKEAGDINKHPELREQASAEYLAETKEKIAEAVKAGNYEGAEKLLHDIQSHLAVKKTEPASAPATAGKEEKSAPSDAETITGTGQDYIGEKLAAGKNIRVLGDAGDWIGYRMSGGEIRVEGNTGRETGNSMSGGEIYVEGDAKFLIGNFMSGGEIHVEGNAEDWTGHFMSGGILRIDGDVASFDETAFTRDNRGTIIWKGQIIWENGQKSEPGWTNLKVEKKIAR